jgi:hypothetical protein
LTLSDFRHVLKALGQESAGAAAGVVDGLTDPCGSTTRTIARMISRGVKNCPPSLPFSPILSSRPS